MWLPEEDIILSHYTELTDLDVDEIVTKQYGNDLLYAFYTKDKESLTAKVLPSFLEYVDVDSSDYFNWIMSEGFDTYSIKFGDTKKLTYNNTNIYSISTTFAGVQKNINIIEKSPENWYYTIGTFVDYDTTTIEKKQNSYGVIINSIYQDLEYIELDCALHVDNNGYDYINIVRADSIKLTLSDKSSFIMATNNVNFDEFTVGNDKYVKFKCIFNIPVEYQSSISSIDFNTFYVDGENASISVNWNN